VRKAWTVCTGVDGGVCLQSIGRFAFPTASFHFREDTVSGVLSSGHLVSFICTEREGGDH